LLKTTKCEDCRNMLSTHDDGTTLTENSFFRNCRKVMLTLHNLIPDISHKKYLKKTMLHHIKSNVDSIGCVAHKDNITKKMNEICVDKTIKNFCNDVNNILSGKINILPLHHNNIQKLALEHVQKKKKIGKYSDIFTNL